MLLSWKVQATALVTAQSGTRYVHSINVKKEEGEKVPQRSLGKKICLVSSFALNLGATQILFLPSLIKAWGRFPVLIMWMMTTNRQEVESKHTLFVVLKGVEIAFRKTNGFSLSPLQTCGLMGSDASQILTLFQKENNFRFLQSM